MVWTVPRCTEAGIHLDEFGGEALGNVAHHDGVAVVEVGVFQEVESIRRSLSIRVETRPLGAMDSIGPISRWANAERLAGIDSICKPLSDQSPLHFVAAEVFVV